MVGDEMAKLLEDFYRVKSAEIREDFFQIDFHQHNATPFLNLWMEETGMSSFFSIVN